MSIAVICPGCKASFRVNDKFAGKQGPCPKCKTVIQIPEKTEEVEVHAPQEYASGGIDSKGRAVTKPIPRTQTKVSPLVLTIGVGGAVVVLAATWMLGSALRRAPGLSVIGLLLISPPIALLGYSFIRDDELEPHRGKSVWIRSIICGLVYVALWVGFSFVPAEYRTEMWNWFFVCAAFRHSGRLGRTGLLRPGLWLGILALRVLRVFDRLLALCGGHGLALGRSKNNRRDAIRLAVFFAALSGSMRAAFHARCDCVQR